MVLCGSTPIYFRITTRGMLVFKLNRAATPGGAGFPDTRPAIGAVKALSPIRVLLLIFWTRIRLQTVIAVAKFFIIVTIDSRRLIRSSRT
jgi:hypothetical protein